MREVRWASHDLRYLVGFVVVDKSRRRIPDQGGMFGYIEKADAQKWLDAQSEFIHTGGREYVSKQNLEVVEMLTPHRSTGLGLRRS